MPPALLIDAQGHKHRCVGCTERHGVNRGGIGIIASSRDPDITMIRADAVRHIEPDPPEPIDMCLRPGMAGFLGHFVFYEQIAADMKI